jgi:hypothetical protein
MRLSFPSSLCAGLAAALLLAGTAAAQDDRETTTPTGAIWLRGQTVAELSAQANAGWRITDLEYESTSSNTFTAALVRNTGSYEKAWWWYVGVTGAQLSTHLSNNNGRLIDLEPYDDNGTTRFAAVMIRNSGADAKAWWWIYDATSTQVNNAVSTNNARLVDLERYTRSGNDRFAAVMIRNTGADARGWSYYYGVSQGSIPTLLNQNNQRPYSIERNSSGTYDLIGIEHGGIGHWYYFGQTAASVTNLLEQNVARTIDIERSGNIVTGFRYDVVMVDNANALERRTWQHFASTDGAYGAWLKEVNGSVLAQIRPDFVFEPASLMKTLYHVHAMRRVALGLDSLNASVPVPLATTGSCPNNSGGTANEPLEIVLSRMMENSDNNRTLAIANRYGVSAINNTAALLGMPSTSVNHVIGCGGPTPNELTLRDIGELHEDVAGGYLLGQRDKFYELMPSTLSFPTWGATDLSVRINSEASTLGLPTWVRDAFRAAITIAYKPGGYTVGGLHYHSEGGFVGVPFKSSNGTITVREYTFGAFNHGTSATLATSRNAVSNATLELVWDRVRAALRTWDNSISGSISSFGSACAGSAGNPIHNGTGTPDIGSTVAYTLSSAARFTPSVLMLGLSNTGWSGGRLPLSLDVLGATGCALRVDPMVSYNRVTDSGGTASQNLPLPRDYALVGISLYTQFLILDRGANPAGLATTNGLRTTVGGFR